MTSCPLGAQSICCTQCSKLGYFGSTVSCQAWHGWLQSSWWPSVLIHLGNSLANVHSGMTLPPAPVSTLLLRVTNWLGTISAGIWTVAKASFVGSISDIEYVYRLRISITPLRSGSLSFPVGWCLQNNCNNTDFIRVGIFISSNFINLLLFSSSFTVFGALVLGSFLTTLAFGLPLS